MFRPRLFVEILTHLESGMYVEDDIVERLVKDYSMYELVKKHGIYRIVKEHLTNLAENGYIEFKTGMITLNPSYLEYMNHLKTQLALKELVLAY